MNKNDINSIVSYCFMGYALGMCFFFLPDYLGRKKSMYFLMIGQAFATHLTIFYSDSWITRLGFFLHGVFHCRISVSYVHCYELMDQSSKTKASTIINAFDASSPMISCLVFTYYDNYVDNFLRTWFYLGCTAIFLYFLVIPESPRWLLMQDPSSKKGITALNYIAWFNGSSYRVPLDTYFNRVDEDIMNISAVATPRMPLKLNISIQEDRKSYLPLASTKKHGFDWNKVVKQIKKLHCHIRFMGPTYKLMAIFTFVLNVYYFGLYNASGMKGNPIKNTTVFSLAETLGVLIGEKAAHHILGKDSKKAMIMSVITILTCSSLIKLVNLSENVMLSLYLVQIFFIGNAFNYLFIL